MIERFRADEGRQEINKEYEELRVNQNLMSGKPKSFTFEDSLDDE